MSKRKTSRTSSIPVLQVEGVTVTRSSKRLLSNVSWTVEPGQHWAILGANGSGKTSLLSVLAGYLAPTKGEISVLGQVYGESDWRTLRQSIGLVSSVVREMAANDEPALLTVISGKTASIDYWGKPSPEDQKEGMRILKSVECQALADRPWMFLSQGERQRVMIGRALMARPRLLILDEPCAGLDPVARETFLGFLERMMSKQSSSDPSVVLVTHHAEEVVEPFTHGMILRKGKVSVADEIGKVMTESALSKAFDADIQLRRRNRRYHLEVRMRAGKVA